MQLQCVSLCIFRLCSQMQIQERAVNVERRHEDLIYQTVDCMYWYRTTLLRNCLYNIQSEIYALLYIHIILSSNYIYVEYNAMFVTICLYVVFSDLEPYFIAITVDKRYQASFKNTALKITYTEIIPLTKNEYETLIFYF